MPRTVKPKRITNINDPRYLKAISHPLRSRLLALLEENASSPVTLAQQVGESLGTVAYHVRTLYDLGLLDLVETRQRRGATEHYYRAREHPRFSDEAWDQLSTVGKQRILTASLNRIHEYASRSAAAGGFDRPDAHFTRTPLKLDEKGWGDLAAVTKRWLADIAKIEEQARGRIEKAPHDAIDAGVVIMLFEALPFSQEALTDAPTERARQAPRRRKARSPAPT